MRILVVDDDDISLGMVAATLEDDGHEVIIANDGRQAQAILTEHDIRFVITDWSMPGMDGVQLCQWIRNQGTSEYRYVIMLTARSMTQDIVHGLSAGADDFISKPFDRTELLVRVKVGERILSLETRHVAIFALAKLSESRDPETGQHLERIREYVRILARAVAASPEWRDRLPRDFVEMTYLTSPLHDIGKVGIPDSVLLKAGRLTDKEFGIMKGHTLIGGETLDAAVAQYPSIEYLCMARDIALYHHERYDGSGYPYGLTGETIPLSARITAVADVYDALTSKRVYKSAFPHDVARGVIVESAGSHFDPLIIEQFLEFEQEMIAVRENFPGA